MNTANMARRTLLQAGAAAVPAMAANLAWGRARVPASERITVAVIGLGSRGFNLIDEFMDQPDAEIVAVCDVDSLHYRDRPWGRGTAFGRLPAKRRIEDRAGKRGVTATSDFREVCGRDDIDAIVVATPDHWHALCVVEALRQGKDVYCEKPITHTFHEGTVVCREVKARKAIFQTGSQQRSDPLFRRAVELVRNGHLGRLQSIEVGLPPGYDRPQGDTAVTEPPAELDYEWWCGPAPKLPYMRARHHRWWRGHLAYGGGVLMDWIGHHNDIAHWAMGMDDSGPRKVAAVNWTFPQTDVYNTPHQYEIRCEYDGGVSTLISSRKANGVKFIGEDGWLFVTRGKLTASNPRWADSDFEIGPQRVYRSYNHVRNFLDGVRSRRECIAPAETAHRSITPGHLGYVAHRVGRPLRWDPETQVIVDDDEADRLLRAHGYREPWNLPAA